MSSSNHNPAVTVLVPCFNEEANVTLLIQRMQPLIEGEGRDWEVVIIDDGSTDRTADLTQQAATRFSWVRLVRHPKNLGLGAALRTGYENALGDIICTMDGDCTYAPETLPILVAEIQKGVDVVTASPWHRSSEKGSVNLFRSFLSYYCSLLYRLILRSDLTCYTSLFRAYRRNAMGQIMVGHDGFSALAEMMVAAIRSGLVVKEVPTRLDRRMHGESKVNLLDTSLSHVRILARLAWLAWQPQTNHQAAQAE